MIGNLEDRPFVLVRAVQRFGTTSDCPGWISVPLMPLARWMAETEEPFRAAMVESESPFFTV